MIRQGVWTTAATHALALLRRLGAPPQPETALQALIKTLAIVPDMPTWVQIETTNRCNFSCAMCPRVLHKLPAEDMPMERFMGIMERLPLPQASLITLFGLGEPLLHEDTFTMVREVKRRGFRAAFTTNGVLLSHEVNEKILSSGLDYIRISVDDDGFGDSTGALHRAASAVIERTEALLAFRAGQTSPEILWNVVASASSAPAIGSIIAKAAQIGMDGVNIINLVSRFSSIAPIPEDRRATLFRQWHRQGRDLGIRIQSTFADRFGLPRFFHRRGLECPQLLGYAYVTMDGDVTPCCHLPRLIMGNLFTESLHDIWHARRFRRFRRVYRSSPTCRDCRLLTWR
ncbi:radical SAM protein [Candidatus Fermentibacteria bacterium]|nr:radical SAM protein [Candidatus Fermentibacteria bacterium]